MNDFVWEETPWERVLPEYSDMMPASLFLTLMEGEDEDTVQQALLDLQQRDILLDVENLDTGASGAKMQSRLLLEKSYAEGNARLRDFDANDPLRLYLRELDNLDTDSGALEKEEKQPEDLMRAYLPQVVRIALSYAGKGVLLMDLIQEGSLSLWQGLSEGEADPARCVHRAMAAAVTMQARQNGVGARLRKMMEDFRRAEKLLLTQLGRNPNSKEIAYALEISEDTAEEIAQMLQNANRDQGKPAEEEIEEIEPDAENEVEATAYFQMRQRVTELLEGLDAVDAEIISLRFGLENGTPLEDAAIAKKLGISAEEVASRAAKAMAAMRKQ